MKVQNHSHAGTIVFMVLSVLTVIVFMWLYPKYQSDTRFWDAKCDEAAHHHGYVSYATYALSTSCTLSLPNGETVWLSYLDYEEPERPPPK